VQTKALSPIERIELIDKIYRTFDSENDRDIEKAWAEESERRIAEYRKGAAETVPAEDVFGRTKDGKI